MNNISSKEITNFQISKFSPKKQDIIVAGIDIGKYEDTIIVAINISKNLPNKVIAADYINGKTTYRKQINKIIDFVKKYNISSVMIDSIPGDNFISSLIGEIYNRKINCAANNFTCNKKSKTELIENLIYKLKFNMLKIYQNSPKIRHLLEEIYFYNPILPDRAGRTVFTLALAQKEVENVVLEKHAKKNLPRKNIWNRMVLWIRKIFLAKHV